MNTGRPVDQRLLDFLHGKIRLACSLHEAIEMSRIAGYSDAAIDEGIDRVRPLDSALIKGRIPSPPLVQRAPPNLRNVGAPKLDLYTLDDFLKPKDCARLIALIRHNLQPSSLTHDYAEPDFRISKTAQLSFLKSPVAEEIDAKICRTLGISAGYSEGIQAQFYEVGGRFRPHFDYFHSGMDENRSACSVRGNRTWTFMVYLNDDFEGGATRFTAIDHEIKPKAGMAVFWNNLAPDGSLNPLTEHCGEVVTQGRKAIITKWFRLLGYGPLFHE